MRGVPRPVIEQFIGTLRFRDEKRCPEERDGSFTLALAKRFEMIRMKYILRRFSTDSKKIRSG